MEKSNYKIYCEGIESEALTQIKNIASMEEFKDSKIIIMPDCLTEDTEVLCSDGSYKLITELKGDEYIANYNSQSGNIFFAPPKSIIIRKQKINEVFYEFGNIQNNFRFCTNAKHRMAIKNNMGIEAELVKDIYIKDLIFNGNGVKAPIKKYDDNLICLVAWIVGDGSIKKTINPRTINYRIRFGVKKERKIQRIIYLLNQLQLKYTVSKYKRGDTTIMINTESSKQLIGLVGLDKQYPKDFLFLSKKQAVIFKDELIQVDGDFENHSYRIYSSSLQQADFLSAFFTINFGLTRVRIKKQGKGGFKTNKTQYYISLIEESLLNYSKSGIHNRKIYKNQIKYSGKVCCIECDSSYFIARQNGFNFITGNCHAGKGCVIGFTATLTDRIIPNLIGVDIGCGMLLTKLGNIEIDFDKLDNVIRTYVPSGKNGHQNSVAKMDKINDLKCYRELKKREYFNKSIGSLGGGNHFLEIDIDNDGSKYLIIHSGSRNLGKQICDYYQDLAKLKVSGLEEYETERAEVIAKYKKENKQGHIQKKLDKLREKFMQETKIVNSDTCSLDGIDKDNYLHDMKIAQEYAVLNRKTMKDIILKHMGWVALESYESIHNYINFSDRIIRKGAISAHKDEKVIIPLNMRDGVILGVGKGNEDWNYSAPHGAGRIMSRAKAKEKLSLEVFEDTMKGIYSTTVNASTLDESPDAYKPSELIIEAIKDTVEIKSIIKPIYNYKASE